MHGSPVSHKCLQGRRSHFSTHGDPNHALPIASQPLTIITFIRKSLKIVTRIQVRWVVMFFLPMNTNDRQNLCVVGEVGK